MKLQLRAFAAVAAAFIPLVHSLADTDTIADADVQQSGYLPNHNMDPAIVDSAQFGQLWKQAFNTNEQVRLRRRLASRNIKEPASAD